VTVRGQRNLEVVNCARRWVMLTSHVDIAFHRMFTGK
jgi:hypothetical protein